MSPEFSHEAARQTTEQPRDLNEYERTLSLLVDLFELTETDASLAQKSASTDEVSSMTRNVDRLCQVRYQSYGRDVRDRHLSEANRLSLEAAGEQSEFVKLYSQTLSLESLLIGPSLRLVACAYGDFPDRAERIKEDLDDESKKLSGALDDLAYPVMEPLHMGNTPNIRGTQETRLLLAALNSSEHTGSLQTKGLLGIFRNTVKVFRGETPLSQDQALEVCGYIDGDEQEPQVRLCRDLRTAGALMSASETMVAVEAIVYSSGQKMNIGERKVIRKMVKDMSSALIDRKGNLVESDPDFTKFFKKQSNLNDYMAKKIEANPDELGYAAPHLKLAHNLNLRTYAASLLANYGEEPAPQEDLSNKSNNEFEVQNKNQEELERQQEVLEEQKRIQEEVDSAVQNFKDEREKQIDEWKISNKTIKDLGLQEINHLLVTGTSDEEGNIILAGRTKEEAKFLLGFLVRLKCMNADELSKELDREQENYSNIKGIEDLLNTSIDGSHLIKSLQETKKIYSMIDEISGSWSAIKNIIEKNWPNGEGVTVARKIEALLLPAMILNEDEQVIIRSRETENEENENGSNEDEDVQVASESDLSAIADQLDQVILPPKPTQEDIERVIDSMPEMSEEVRNTIDWDRLRNLALVAEMFNGNLYRAKKEALGGAPAYFVVLFGTENGFYAIAETPAKGNATYVVAERIAAGSCLEVLSLPKEDAREAGAMRIIHRDSSSSMLKPSERHLQKIIEAMQELETVKGLAA